MIALVIPAELTAPPRLVGWPTEPELLPMLYSEIGCVAIHSFRISHPPVVELTVWADVVGLLADTIDQNTRAVSFTRGLGYAAPGIAGTAVLTGPPNVAGEITGLPPALARRLFRMFERVGADT